MRQPALPDAIHLVALETVGSTNTEAKRLAEVRDGASSEFTLVWAKEQTDGRGRRGRDWVSPRGNLYTSILMRPNAPVADVTAFSFIAAIAVVEALSGFSPAGHQIRCKWPNDVLVNGKKIAGILMETASGGTERPKWLVVGMGLNVETFPLETAYPATSLRAEGWSAAVEDILARYCDRFVDWSRRWTADGFDGVRRTWLANCVGLGEEIRIHLGDGDITGVFEDMDESGTLVVNKSGKRQRITAGDVFFW